MQDGAGTLGQSAHYLWDFIVSRAWHPRNNFGILHISSRARGSRHADNFPRLLPPPSTSYYRSISTIYTDGRYGVPDRSEPCIIRRTAPPARQGRTAYARMTAAPRTAPLSHNSVAEIFTVRYTNKEWRAMESKSVRV